jgi:two-component system chemotaxis response regulator CheY
MKQGLIVDDSAVIRKVASRILELMQFETSEADDGAKALELCGQAMPDVILLDWSLPQTDIIDFLRTVRRLPGGQGAKIIFCATENDPVVIGRALRAGADDVLLKPFEHRTVQEKFEDVGLLS